MDELPDHTAEPDAELLEITTLPESSRLPFPRPSRRILSGAAILAAVLVVALFASLFRYHLGNSPSSPEGSTITLNTLDGISMVSPNEGWMIGNEVRYRIKSLPTATPGRSGVASYAPLNGLDAVSVNMLLYHFQSGAWTRVPIRLSGNTPHLIAISMDSATDGWAAGWGASGAPAGGKASVRGFLLHYNGRTWTPLWLPVAGMLSNVRMVAPNDGWAVGTQYGASLPMPIILHYDGTTWSQQALPASLSQGAGTHEALAVRGLAALPTGDAWVMLTRFPFEGAVTVNPTNGGTGISSGATITGSAPGAQSLPDTVILHSSSGSWTVQATLPGTVLNGFDMAAPDSGWAVGSGAGLPPAHIASPTALDSPLFLRYAGGTWSPGPTKVLSDDSHQLMLSTLSMLSPTDGWAVGVSQGTQVAMTGTNGGQPPMQSGPPIAQEAVVLAHFDGTTWVPLKGPSLPSGTLAVVGGASFGAPGDVWIVGSLLMLPRPGNTSNAPGMITRTTPLLLHYAGGVWSTVDLQV